MNDIITAMKTRRAVRAYTDEPVAKEDLEKIIEAGLWAPTGMGKQDPIIVAVTNPELIARLSKLNAEVVGMPEGRDPFYGAPAVLVVLADKSAPTYVYDGSLCMGNLMLAAHSLGLGSCWIHRAKESFESEEGKAILAELGIEGDYEGIGNCIVGHPAQEPAPRDRNDGRVFWAE